MLYDKEYVVILKVQIQNDHPAKLVLRMAEVVTDNLNDHPNIHVNSYDVCPVIDKDG